MDTADISFLNEAATTVSDAVASRRSIRAFTEKPVDPTELRELIELAARAPSGGNLQPWRIIVYGGEELARLKAAIGERIEENSRFDEPEYNIYPPGLTEPYNTYRFRVGEQLYNLLGIPREDKLGRFQQLLKNYQFFGAPVGLFCYVDRQMGPAQWSDLGMYLQTLMLLLRERGLSSCAQECWATYHTSVDAFVKPPSEWMLFCGMAIGYPDLTHPINHLHAERMPLEEFTEFRGL